MLLADVKWANTIAGAITPILFLIGGVLLSLILGRVVKHFDDQHDVMAARMDAQDTALSVNTQAVARIMQTIDNWEHTLLQVPALQDSVSRLEERIRAHDNYARQREQALSDDIRSLQDSRRSGNRERGRPDNA